MLKSHTLAPIVAIIALAGCNDDAAVTSQNEKISDLAQQYPRIDPGNIAIPPASALTRPDFDIGGYCLAQEEAGNGSFEMCLEVLGRELLALGGPR